MIFPRRKFDVAGFPSVAAAVEACRISGVGIGVRLKTLPGRGGFVEKLPLSR